LKKGITRKKYSKRRVRGRRLNHESERSYKTLQGQSLRRKLNRQDKLPDKGGLKRRTSHLEVQVRASISIEDYVHHTQTTKKRKKGQ